MRRVPEGEIIDYPPVDVYLDDLLEIEEVLRTRGDELRIATPGAEWDTVEALAAGSDEKVLHKLELQVREPYLQVEFQAYRCGMYLSDKWSVEQRGIKSVVSAALHRHRPRLRGSLAHPLAILGVGLLLGIMVGVASLAGGKTAGGLAVVAVVGIYAAVALWSFRAAKRHSTIHLVRWQERSSFWRRNGDQVVVALIGAVLGAVVGSIMTAAIGTLVLGLHH